MSAQGKSAGIATTKVDEGINTGPLVTMEVRESNKFSLNNNR